MTSTLTAETLVRFDDVGMEFDDGTLALSGIELSIAAGEFVSIVGPSGCGKSTLLRITSGLDSPTEGTVTVSVPDVGYVFQDATLLPWRSVRRNVELLAELDGMPSAERRARSAEIVRLVGLEGFEDALPQTLSGGMRMRVSLARALVVEPRLFLFDEPFGALDEITREVLNDELQKLYSESSFAGIFVTHSVPEAVLLSTRVIVMSGRPGRVIADVPVPFPFPRRPELRFEPEFAAVSGRVSRALRTGAE